MAQVINVEIVAEYEVDLDRLVEHHPELWEDVDGDIDVFISELIENNWIQPYDLGEQTFVNIKAF